MMAILVTSQKEEEGTFLCEKLKEITEKSGVLFAVIGPAQANVSKIKDIYRKMIYIKHPDKEEILALKSIMEEKIKHEYAGIKAEAAFDLNPVSGY
jgi:primosomal protein N' (replication factor Y)